MTKPKLHYTGPIVLAIMDGVGLSTRRSGNAVRQAHTEFLDYAMLNYLNIPLQASGEAVGIMKGQMGNSEVGHNAIGSGQIIQQGIASIEADFATGAIWQSKAWRGVMDFLKSPVKTLGAKALHSAAEATKPAKTTKITTKSSTAQAPAKTTTKSTTKSTAANFWKLQAAAAASAKAAARNAPVLHFAGIFSDGGVHSDIKYLEQMIAEAYREGVHRIRIHAIFDGRDVAPQSEPKYINHLETFIKNLTADNPDADIKIASGGGRMTTTADRYGNDWGMVERGWNAMVHGQAPRTFRSASDAIKTFRRECPSIQDQYLPTFVITDANNQPVGKVNNGDAFIYFDFRADRAVEIATAFTADKFTEFKRGAVPHIYFAGLTEYNADQHIPAHVLVPPIKITDTLNTFLGQHKITQLAISETAKFGHITYYFNGNSYKKAPGETHIEIPSYTEPFNTRPWMRSAEITDAALDNLERYNFVRINFAAGDMVGHFAELEPTITAIEAIDIQLARLARRIDELGGMMIITADHGNAEELLDASGQPRTAHTTNPVPCIFYDNTKNAKLYRDAKLPDAGITNIASTIALLCGQPDYPCSWRSPLIKLK